MARTTTTATIAIRILVSDDLLFAFGVLPISLRGASSEFKSDMARTRR